MGTGIPPTPPPNLLPMVDFSTLLRYHSSNSVEVLSLEVFTKHKVQCPDLILVCARQYRVLHILLPQSAGHCNSWVSSVSSPVFHTNQWVLQSSLILPTTHLALHKPVGAAT